MFTPPAILHRKSFPLKQWLGAASWPKMAATNGDPEELAKYALEVSQLLKDVTDEWRADKVRAIAGRFGLSVLQN
jgi:hypothetical protein